MSDAASPATDLEAALNDAFELFGSRLMETDLPRLVRQAVASLRAQPSPNPATDEELKASVARMLDKHRGSLEKLAASPAGAPPKPDADYTLDEALAMAGGTDGIGPGSLRELVAAFHERGFLLAGAPPSPALTGWQPIATAPKDGTFRLVYANGVVCKALRWIVDGEDRGWFQDGVWCDRINPTHWMPLPLPPSGIAHSEPGRHSR